MDAKIKKNVAEQVDSVGQGSKLYRYSQLALLVIAAGAIYPVLYLRQLYQSSMLVGLGIDDMQLGYLYSGLGWALVLSYIPSGWLADRVPAKVLISFSLLGTGALALWYATFPSFRYLLLIFIGFGLTTGLTFWAALLKRLKSLATKEEQGRFFGFLDGGRGLVEATLATLVYKLFTHYTKVEGQTLGEGFQHVIHVYAYLCLTLGLIVAILPSPSAPRQLDEVAQTKRGNLLSDLAMLSKIPELWLMAAIIFCGYHLFVVTYSFSAYLELDGFGFAAAAAAGITTIKLWTRPFGGIGGGWLGDLFTNLRVLTVAIALATLGVIGLVAAPMLKSGVVAAGFVIFVGLMAYAIRGLYWAILDVCNVPVRVTGLAIGIVSVIGYSPDTYVPLLNGWLTQHFGGALGYQLYYSYIAVVGVLGVIAACTLQKRINRRESA
ncbi:MFS transporter [Dyella caseinilytica]|uniref:MFS transporter n=1 Tax=Dyella caseinilytica TaxID=1849581 RepID=A0ABX7GPE5_9GAMM|nr:MFS transporter [Dyella caseinilytica]QRN52294.1 MFS transporter [Dyella caseinilytica]GGA14645.1 MFS transporter [Dyella caseinilytica]